MAEFKPSKLVDFKKCKDYAIIRWNRPERKNAIIKEMQATATHYLGLAASDDTIKLVVLTGTGDYYTSGADFLSSIDQRKSSLSTNDSFGILVAALIKFPKPIIAAVNGPTIGMGVTTLPLCDVVYASSDSTFLTPFSRIGLVPEACSSYTFPRIMGYAKANEMLLFNRTLSSAEACNCGLVTEVFPKETLMKEVEKRVHEFVDNPVMALVLGKRLIRGRDMEMLLKINKEECEVLEERFMSDDVVNQAAKFMAKREEIKRRRRAKL